MKFCFIQLIRFCGDNARFSQRVSINLNTMVGQAACRLMCRYAQSMLTLHPAFAESYQLLHVNQAKELVAVRV